MESNNNSVFTEKLEILSVKLQQNERHQNCSNFFESLMELDKYIECVPSVLYQFHGLQKAADSTTLFIFCLNQNDVKRRFTGEERDCQIAITSILPASLTDVWKQIDRWNPVYCICWFDEETLGNVGRTEYLTHLFLTCIPPSSISSSICVLNVADNNHKGIVDKALSSCRFKTKTSKVTNFSLLKEMLNTLLDERLTSVRNNAKYLLEHVKSEMLSKEIHGNRILCHRSARDLNLSSPTSQNILKLISREFPKVDERLLKNSFIQVFVKDFIKRFVVATRAVLLPVVFVSCCLKSYYSILIAFVLILLFLIPLTRTLPLCEKQICRIIQEYNTSIRQRVHLIDQLHSYLGDVERENVLYRDEYKDRFLFNLKAFFYAYVYPVLLLIHIPIRVALFLKRRIKLYLRQRYHDF